MDTSTDTPATEPQPQRRGLNWPLLRRGAIAVGLVSGGFVLGAGTWASAGGGGMMPWAGGFHHGSKIGMIQHVVHGALENVGATTAQEDKIHDIVAATYTEVDQGKEGRDAMRKQVIDLLRAPTIDRAAVEKLRSEKVADFDAKSKKIVGAVLDAAGQLTPEQRAKLAQNFEERMAHPGWGEWRRGGDEHGGGGRDRGDDHGSNDRGDHG